MSLWIYPPCLNVINGLAKLLMSFVSSYKHLKKREQLSSQFQYFGPPKTQQLSSYHKTKINSLLFLLDNLHNEDI